MPHNLYHIDLALIDGKFPVNRKVLLFAMEMLLNRTVFPPIELERKPGGRFKINNGRHRVSAHKLLGRSRIWSKVGAQRAKTP